jgi:hypothetical protein
VLSLPDENLFPPQDGLEPSHSQTNSLRGLTIQQASEFLAFPTALHKIFALFPLGQVALQVARGQCSKRQVHDNYLKEDAI